MRREEQIARRYDELLNSCIDTPIALAQVAEEFDIAPVYVEAYYMIWIDGE